MGARFLMCGLVLALCARTAAQDVSSATDINILNAWARPTAVREMTMTAEPTHRHSQTSTTAVSAVYLTLENASDADMSLTAVKTPAGTAQLHESRMENDMAMMHEMNSSLVIAAGETVMLQPGGLHIMLTDILQPLYVDEAISLTLTFARSDATTFDLIIGVPVLEADPDAARLLIREAWARPTVTVMDAPHMMGTPEAMSLAAESATAEAVNEHGMSSVSAAYMQITNLSEDDDRLVSVTSPAAERVEMHTIVMVNDVATMQELSAGLDLPTGETIVLQPGGDHIMLMALTRDLQPGEALVVTLHLASGRTQTVAVPIYTPAMP